MKQFETIVGIAFVGFIVVLGVMYVTASMVSLDNSVNVTGTEYEDIYDTTTDTSIASLSLLTVVPWLVAIAAIIIALMWLKNSAGRQGGW